MKVGVTSVTVEQGSLARLEIVAYGQTISPEIYNAIHSGKQLHLSVIPYESHSTIQPRQFRQEYEATFMNEKSTIPHCERITNSGQGYARPNMVSVQGNGLMGTATVEDESVEIKVNLLGVEPERIKIRRIDNILRVSIDPEKVPDFDVASQSFNTRSLEYILAEGETFESGDLDLGVLTILTHRDRDIEDYEVE